VQGEVAQLCCVGGVVCQYYQIADTANHQQDNPSPAARELPLLGGAQAATAPFAQGSFFV